MNNSHTPETDSHAGYPDDSGCWKYNIYGLYVDADFSRKLELERDKLREERDRYKRMWEESRMETVEEVE